MRHDTNAPAPPGDESPARYWAELRLELPNTTDLLDEQCEVVRASEAERYYSQRERVRVAELEGELKLAREAVAHLTAELTSFKEGYANLNVGNRKLYDDNETLRAELARLREALEEAEAQIIDDGWGPDEPVRKLIRAALATPPAEGGAEIGNTSGISGANSQGSAGDPPRDTDTEGGAT